MVSGTSIHARIYCVRMPTSKETVTFLLEQLAPLDVQARAMFGEYGLYCDEKVVGFISNELLFVKPGKADAGFGPETVAAPPYPGTKALPLIEVRGTSKPLP